MLRETFASQNGVSTVTGELSVVCVQARKEMGRVLNQGEKPVLSRWQDAAQGGPRKVYTE